MAEQALYGYKDDPVFPYEYVAKHISWVPDFINNLTPLRGHEVSQACAYHSLLNILLVFCRARTSTIINRVSYDPSSLKTYQRFIARLNGVLDKVPNGNGRVQRLEIFRYTRAIWFVTAKDNSRFIWKRRLTHREIGLNLDYYGAGHLDFGDTEFRTRCWSRMVEVSGHSQIGIIIESLFLNYIPDLTVAYDFFRRKEELLNSSMNQLNLPYRFKWFWEPPDNWKEVDKVLEGDRPPSESWWQSNSYFVSVRMKPDLRHHGMTFCSATSQYIDFWSLIQDLYNWTASHALSDESLHYPRYWANMEVLFSLVRSVVDGQTAYDDDVKAKIQASKAELTEFHNRILTGTCDVNEYNKSFPPGLPREPYLVHIWRQRVGYMRMDFIETWKKPPRRRFEEVDYPSNSGDCICIGKAREWRWTDLRGGLRMLIAPSRK
jgi:hypothetical protein